jgi:hypothetical protein
MTFFIPLSIALSLTIASQRWVTEVATASAHSSINLASRMSIMMST